MKLILKSEQLTRVASRWKRQYCRPDGTWIQLYAGKDSEIIYKALLALPDPATQESDIDKIIGNKNWTQLICNECEEDVDKLVQLGEALDYESHTAHVCPACLAKAFNLAMRGS